jgi:hypothetical protein
VTVGREMFTTLASNVDIKMPIEMLRVTHQRRSIAGRDI